MRAAAVLALLPALAVQLRPGREVGRPRPATSRSTSRPATCRWRAATTRSTARILRSVRRLRGARLWSGPGDVGPGAAGRRGGLSRTAGASSIARTPAARCGARTTAPSSSSRFCSRPRCGPGRARRSAPRRFSRAGAGRVPSDPPRAQPPGHDRPAGRGGHGGRGGSVLGSGRIGPAAGAPRWSRSHWASRLGARHRAALVVPASRSWKGSPCARGGARSVTCSSRWRSARSSRRSRQCAAYGLIAPGVAALAARRGRRVRFQLRLTTGARPSRAGLLGETSRLGWRHYFAVAPLVKIATPGFLVAVGRGGQSRPRAGSGEPVRSPLVGAGPDHVRRASSAGPHPDRRALPAARSTRSRSRWIASATPWLRRQPGRPGRARGRIPGRGFSRRVPALAVAPRGYPRVLNALLAGGP